MPIWALLYLLLYTVFNVHGSWVAFRRSGPTWGNIRDGVCSVALMALFATYWHPPDWGPFRWFPSILYLAAAFGELTGIRRIARDAARLDLKLDQDVMDILTDYYTCLISTTVFLLLLCMPLFIVGGMAAFRPAS
jgi:hypothetical protein